MWLNTSGVSAFFTTRLPAWHASVGSVIEFECRRKDGETFVGEACISTWQGTDGIQYGAIVRDISIRKREAERFRYERGLVAPIQFMPVVNSFALSDKIAAWVMRAACT